MTEESDEGLTAWGGGTGGVDDEDEDGACFGRTVLGDYRDKDYSNLALKPDHYNRPLWVCSDGRIFLETYSPIYKQVGGREPCTPSRAAWCNRRCNAQTHTRCIMRSSYFCLHVCVCVYVGRTCMSATRMGLEPQHHAAHGVVLSCLGPAVMLCAQLCVCNVLACRRTTSSSPSLSLCAARSQFMSMC